MNWTTKPDRSIWRFMQTYPTMTAAMMRITIPVTSPPRNVPTSIPTGFPSSCGLAKMVGLGFSACGSSVDVGLGCGSGVQEGLHTVAMVAVWLPTEITVLVLAALSLEHSDQCWCCHISTFCGVHYSGGEGHGSVVICWAGQFRLLQVRRSEITGTNFLDCISNAFFQHLLGVHLENVYMKKGNNIHTVSNIELL